MKKKYTKILSLLIITLVALMGCSSKNTESINDSNEITIVTSFYPIYISTLNIIKDVPNVKLINMTKAQTGCLHDYQLSPEDLKTLSSADIFVVNGAGMEGFLDKVISNEKDLDIVDSSEGIKLLTADGEEHSHDDENHNHDEEETHADDHDHEDNPHVWVSISNNIKQVQNIADGLAKYDPDNADKYEANAKEYISKLEALKTEMHEVIDTLPNRNIITFHEAFPYFAEEFNLNIVGVVEVEPGTEPSPKQLEETIEIAKNNNVKALFTEPQYAAKAATTISNETGIPLYTLDPIVTGDSTSDAYDDYITKMEQNLETLKEALK
ncbi:zinc ABC transporter substrate-binding protein [Clostridium sp. NSJ-49]|uniref:metal ABC transporter substrate-binding protein n=1 Tax=Clostridium TaxID=1485 RepID=UPI00164A986D|nr:MULTISPECIES: metal ABC transporter substrate-binding protein [unclassified Clostridium]MBC5624685.1 zinc ABC transporter substrate-binding protein [Clostridium sp. NSJ-49]MCD2501956.1 zinc ABC transporter substrate-binding protein [Clostridium sp. NSJ-145]MDU6341467.1 metal ABC transporter substrate-binding protein [Clostridium sp.]